MRGREKVEGCRELRSGGRAWPRDRKSCSGLLGTDSGLWLSAPHTALICSWPKPGLAPPSQGASRPAPGRSRLLLDAATSALEPEAPLQTYVRWKENKSKLLPREDLALPTALAAEVLAVLLTHLPLGSPFSQH